MVWAAAYQMRLTSALEPFRPAAPALKYESSPWAQSACVNAEERCLSTTRPPAPLISSRSSRRDSSLKLSPT